MQARTSVILQMRFSAHGWLLETLLAFHLVQAAIGTSMFFFSSVCSLIDLGFMSQQLELVLMLSSYNR
jgi:hypothetical protein